MIYRAGSYPFDNIRSEGGVHGGHWMEFVRDNGITEFSIEIMITCTSIIQISVVRDRIYTLSSPSHDIAIVDNIIDFSNLWYLWYLSSPQRYQALLTTCHELNVAKTPNLQFGQREAAYQWLRTANFSTIDRSADIRR